MKAWSAVAGATLSALGLVGCLGVGALGLGGCLGISEVEHSKASTGGSGAGSGGGGTVRAGGACWGDQKSCDGACVAKSDPKTGCAGPSCEPCNLPHATAICGDDGQCAIGVCESGWQNCDANQALGNLTGCEAHTEFDPTACGPSCTNCIATRGQSYTCVNGACSQASNCPQGKQDCDGAAGCETDKKDPNNCGFCGNVCSFPHSSGKCNADSAAPAGYSCDFSCTPPYADCDGVLVNGCETNLGNDTTHCGLCGTECNGVNGTASCVNGTCVTNCNVGFGDCDDNPSNGCEAALNTLFNCGSCGSACLAMHAIGATCASGSCKYASCQVGFADCNGNAADGCETPTTTTSNCGGCGFACAPPHAQSPTCATGTCKFTSCQVGWGDCDTSYGNGCETPLNTANNCGACGNACGQCCSTGLCQPC